MFMVCFDSIIYNILQYDNDINKQGKFYPLPELYGIGFNVLSKTPLLGISVTTKGLFVRMLGKLLDACI
jgi:high-affinity nickel permease